MTTLPIKKKWFDMILSGEEGEEYRDDTPYYRSRFDRFIGVPAQVKFRNGYRKDSPSVVCTAVSRGADARTRKVGGKFRRIPLS